MYKKLSKINFKKLIFFCQTLVNGQALTGSVLIQTDPKPIKKKSSHGLLGRDNLTQILKNLNLLLLLHFFLMFLSTAAALTEAAALCYHRWLASATYGCVMPHWKPQHLIFFLNSYYFHCYNLVAVACLMAWPNNHVLPKYQ